MIVILIIIQLLLSADKDTESNMSRLKQTLVYREEVTQKMTLHWQQNNL